jgi:hypothetical protein
MTAAAPFFREPAWRGAHTQIPTGMSPAWMPPGSAFHAPPFVGNNGDVK